LRKETERRLAVDQSGTRFAKRGAPHRERRALWRKTAEGKNVLSGRAKPREGGAGCPKKVLKGKLPAKKNMEEGLERDEEGAHL